MNPCREREKKKDVVFFLPTLQERGSWGQHGAASSSRGGRCHERQGDATHLVPHQVTQPKGHVLHQEHPRQWQKAPWVPRRTQRAQGQAQCCTRRRQTASELSCTKASALLAEPSWMSQQPMQQAQLNEQTQKKTGLLLQAKGPEEEKMSSKAPSVADFPKTIDTAPPSPALQTKQEQKAPRGTWWSPLHHQNSHGTNLRRVKTCNCL